MYYVLYLCLLLLSIVIPLSHQMNYCYYCLNVPYFKLNCIFYACCCALYAYRALSLVYENREFMHVSAEKRKMKIAGYIVDEKHEI